MSDQVIYYFRMIVDLLRELRVHILFGGLFDRVSLENIHYIHVPRVVTLCICLYLNISTCYCCSYLPG